MSSNHPGGVNGVFVDGSVRFIGDGINTGNLVAPESSAPSPYGVWGRPGFQGWGRRRVDRRYRDRLTHCRWDAVWLTQWPSRRRSGDRRQVSGGPRTLFNAFELSGVRWMNSMALAKPSFCFAWIALAGLAFGAGQGVPAEQGRSERTSGRRQVGYQGNPIEDPATFASPSASAFGLTDF